MLRRWIGVCLGIATLASLNSSCRVDDLDNAIVQSHDKQDSSANPDYGQVRTLAFNALGILGNPTLSGGLTQMLASRSFSQVTEQHLEQMGRDVAKSQKQWGAAIHGNAHLLKLIGILFFSAWSMADLGIQITKNPGGVSDLVYMQFFASMGSFAWSFVELTYSLLNDKSLLRGAVLSWALQLPGTYFKNIVVPVLKHLQSAKSNLKGLPGKLLGKMDIVSTWISACFSFQASLSEFYKGYQFAVGQLGKADWLVGSRYLTRGVLILGIIVGDLQQVHGNPFGLLNASVFRFFKFVEEKDGFSKSKIVETIRSPLDHAWGKYETWDQQQLQEIDHFTFEQWRKAALQPNKNFAPHKKESIRKAVLSAVQDPKTFTFPYSKMLRLVTDENVHPSLRVTLEAMFDEVNFSYERIVQLKCQNQWPGMTCNNTK